jgi:glyoxylase-like metal-dependent hydrolase (beta-lactamase superfamily II)
MCLVDSETGGVFVGDAVGITLPGSHLVRPTVPPPDIDTELLVSQLGRLAERGVTSINFAHFGIDHEVAPMLDQAERRVRRWDAIVADAVAEGLEVPAIAERLSQVTHDDYVVEGFSAEVIAAAEDRTEYESEAAGLYRAHTH